MNKDIGKAVLIKADGTVLDISPANGTDFSLAELQEFVGGLIQIGATYDGRNIVMDEEGKLKGKPVNDKATELYRYGQHDPIVGDVVVCNTNLIK